MDYINMANQQRLTVLTLVTVLFVVSVVADCPINNCDTCSEGICYSCGDGYELRNNGCIAVCDEYCTKCTSPGVCEACSTSAILNTTTKQCQINCTIGFNGRCTACSNFYYCDACTSEFSLSNYSRYCSRKLNCGQNCLQCSTNNSNATCTVCKIGYKVETVISDGTNSSTCIADICYIPYCLVCSSASTCSVCVKNYQLTLISTVCSPVCNIDNCFQCSNSTNCQVCYVGYILANSKCSAVCSISNCSVCKSSSTCLSCSSGYKLSLYGKSCQVQCNDKNCLTCLNTTTCSTCKLGYNASTGVCLRSCLPGFTTNIHGACLKCSGNIPNCNSCFVSSSDVFTCIQCQHGYYISSNPPADVLIEAVNSCSACNFNNCLQCKNSSFCSLCSQNFKVDSQGNCISNCSALNCDVCSANDTNLCSVCSPGYILQNDTCTITKCTTGKLLINGVCSCPIGAFDSGSGLCSACSDYKCLNCTVSICSSCKKGYYNLNGQCLACIQDCTQCIDSTSCSVCKANYIYFNGSCSYLANGFSGISTSVAAIYTCPAGCSSCSLGTDDNLLDCTILAPGYSISGSFIIRCGQLCLSCASQTVCLSCYAGYVLVGQKCVKCNDTNALSCLSSNNKSSVSCLSGYTVVYNNSIGVCQSCGINCYKCDINGAGNCDPGKCYIGYVQVLGTKNCTQCVNNCPLCDENDPSVCTSCGLRRYKNYKGLCLGCKNNCKECTNSTACTSCQQGYILTNSACQASPEWPCAFGSNTTCTLAVQQFTLSKGKYTYNSTCNKTAKCSYCVYGYYLVLSQQAASGYCMKCPNIANCLSCDRENTSRCFLCKDGYFAQSGTCYNCLEGCKQCSSRYYCLQPKAGYYLITNSDGSYNGRAGKCSSPCAACDFGPDYCTSCTSGYIINGSACFSSKVIYYEITFVKNSIFSKNDSFAVAYGKLLNNIGLLRQQICYNLPDKVTVYDKNCVKCFNFLRFTQGSINMKTQINIANYQSLSEATADINSKSLINNAQIITTSTTSQGLYDTNNTIVYEYKTALVLAIVIPLVFLILMIIITSVYYYRSKKANPLVNIRFKNVAQQTANPSAAEIVK